MITKDDIARWINYAKQEKYEFIISVCDTFDYEDYPVYCKDKKELKEKFVHYDGVNMQQINEVIHIKDEKIQRHFLI